MSDSRDFNNITLLVFPFVSFPTLYIIIWDPQQHCTAY